MAESADILRAPHQKVVLPGSRRRLLDGRHGAPAISSRSAGASSSRWASAPTRSRTAAPGVIPVTYINSSAAIKAFVGEHGGIVCTSTNAAAVMTWAWERGEKLLMLPDQHLGRNTAFKMGVPLDEMVVWDPNEMWGGLEPEQVKSGEADPVEGPLLGPHALHRRSRSRPSARSTRTARSSRTRSARSTSCRPPT